MPAYSVVTGCNVNSNVVTTPKLPPPPRTAQKRSGFSVALARRTWPSAVTISTPTTLSHARPCLRMSQPSPPPNVRPPTPVLEMRPPVVARPCGCVAASKSRQSAPPCTPAVHREHEIVVAREVDGCHHVGGGATSHDHAWGPVDHPVPEPAGLIVARITASDDSATESCTK